jgi:signal transduction histidine kinase
VELDFSSADDTLADNLIRNAIQASSAGETVQIDLTQRHDLLAIGVRDRGPGIPRETIPRIFEPFFTTKHGSSEAGMGLGLSVSQSLAEAMGGRIEVSSDHSKGTLFTAVLPRRIAVEESNLNG